MAEPIRKGDRTRSAILREAASLATVHGLEGLSIGNLAAALGMSKSGLYSHFGSKQELQLATIDEAGGIFLDEVVKPALDAPPGLAQLHVLCQSFFTHLTRRTFPGGCFFAGAVLEMGTRPGPVKAKITEFQAMFLGTVAEFARIAIERGQLPADDDPAQVAFEVNGILLAADAAFVTQDDERALELPRKAIARRLGPPPSHADGWQSVASTKCQTPVASSPLTSTT